MLASTPIPSALTAGEALIRRLALEKSNIINDDADSIDESVTQISPVPHGDAFRQKILQKKGEDSDGSIDDKEEQSHGQALLKVIKQSRQNEVAGNVSDDIQLKQTRGEFLLKKKLLLPILENTEAEDQLGRPAISDLTRGQILKELLQELIENNNEIEQVQQQQHASKLALTKGETLKVMIQKVQQEHLQKSVAKTRGEMLKLMLERQIFSRHAEASFSKLVAEQQADSAVAEFWFNDLAQRFVLRTGAGVLQMDVSKHLAYVLGFENTRLFHGEQAKYMPDLSGGVKQLYVYAPKLIEECIIGDKMAPLLRVVNVSTTPGGTDVPEVIYTNEIFHSLQNKHISEIRIEIQNAFGRYVKFNWGTCIVTLHFRRKLF